MLVLRKTKRYMTFLSLVLVFVVILSTEARANPYGFEVITPANSSNADAMASQLSLEIVDLGGNPYQVGFIFKNDLGEDGIVTAVALEDGTLFDMGIPYMVYGTAVVFVEDTSPPSGTWGLGFDTNSNFFRADEVSAVDNGVNPNEALGVVFDLQDGMNFSDVITALELGFTTSNPTQYDGDNIIPGTGTTLRIGIHVQRLLPDDDIPPDGDGDRSDAYILTPIPGAVLLGILGLGVAGLKLRKFA